MRRDRRRVGGDRIRELLERIGGWRRRRRRGTRRACNRRQGRERRVPRGPIDEEQIIGGAVNGAEDERAEQDSAWPVHALARPTLAHRRRKLLDRAQRDFG